MVTQTPAWKNASEIISHQRVSLLQEAISLIRVGKVGGSTYHVGNCSVRTPRQAALAARVAEFSFVPAHPVHFRGFAREPLFQVSCFFRDWLQPILPQWLCAQQQSSSVLHVLRHKVLSHHRKMTDGFVGSPPQDA